MKNVYILYFVAYKRCGENVRPRMVDTGIIGAFKREEDAKSCVMMNWPEPMYDPEGDFYRYEINDKHYVIYQIRHETIRKKP